jgi:hypothetical protein
VLSTLRTGRAAAAFGTACLSAALLAPTANAQEQRPPNHREVPNAACGQDTPQAAFPDRDAAAETHRRNVDCVAARGVAQGSDGAYQPLETVTRAQMASFVARTLEAGGHQLPPPQDQGFEDVHDSVHRDRIRQLAEAGIVRGRTADRYEPRGEVTRAQMASYLVRAASWAHDAEYQPRGEDAYFLDIEDSVHADNVRAGYELFLFEGTRPGEYEPGRAVRRDAMATFLTRSLDLVHAGEHQSSHQTYLVAPQEPYQGLAPGSQAEFRVASRYSDVGDEVRQSLHLALFPCAAVDTDDLPATFADADGSGTADGIGATDTQLAHIDTVNGQPTDGQPKLVRNAPPQDGVIELTVVSPAADCTVLVVFDDRPPVDELRVDARGLAANPYGIGKASWQ